MEKRSRKRNSLIAEEKSLQRRNQKDLGKGFDLRGSYLENPHYPMGKERGTMLPYESPLRLKAE